MDIREKLDKIISESDFCIAYQAMRDEVDPESLPFRFPATKCIVPKDQHLDALEHGKRIKEKFSGRKGIIFLPGRRFDRFGGRYGRGGGWFDRFISTVPAEWVRIGICRSEDFSDERLPIEKWDQLVDWVIVVDKGKCEIFETHAKQA